MVNLVILVGRLGHGPELKYTPQGHPVVSRSIATKRTWKNAEGQEQKETEWHAVLAWHNLAEACNQYLKKGSLVYFKGRLHTRDWEDEQQGKQRRTKVIAEEVKFLDKRRATQPMPEEDIPS